MDVAVLAGTEPPSARVGRPGDYYVDTTTHCLYGPKLRVPRRHSGWGHPLDLLILAGPQGTRALTDRAGTAGAVGVTGVTGDQRVRPVIGATGPRGDKGERGPTGATGARGAPGARGERGQRGSTGATGVRGATGAQGAPGKHGPTGAPGVPGVTGARGEVGRRGFAGVTGATGPMGATGATGVAGEAGQPGFAGATGATGPVGATGADGTTGATGEVGERGFAGVTGSAGPVGATGATGEVGERGPAGATGAIGATGASGSSQQYTVLGGVGPPNSSLGVDGDFFIDTATAQIYGPRSSGSWGSPATITGPISGQPGGLATLDGRGTLLVSQLPPSVVITEKADQVFSAEGAGLVNQGQALGMWIPGASPPPRTRVAVITDCQSGNTFAVHQPGPGCTVSIDTAVFARGMQSLRLTTNGAGGAVSARATGLNPVSSVGRHVVFEVMVDNPALLAGLEVYASSDLFTNFWEAELIAQSSIATTVLVPGQWFTFTIPWGAFIPEGNPDRAAITGWQVRCADNGSGTAVNVWFNLLGTTPEPATGVVSWTFDDGWYGAYSIAAPYMDKYGFCGGAFPIQSNVGVGQRGGDNPAGSMTLAQLHALQNQKNWEVGAHAFSVSKHNAWNTLSQAEMESDILLCKAWLRANGFRGGDFHVIPLGINTAINAFLSQKYFTCARATDGQTRETYPPGNPLRLRAVSTHLGQSIVNAYIDEAAANNEWLILETHNVVGEYVTHDGTETLTADFTAIADHLHLSGLPVKTLGDVCKSGIA